MIWWGFGPFWAAGTDRNFGARAKDRKTQFPGARGSGTGKKVATLSRMVVQNFLTVYVLTDLTPTGGNTRNTRILGHLGALTLEKSRARAENGKSQFPGAEGPVMKK